MARKRVGWIWICILCWLMIGSGIPNVVNAERGNLQDTNMGMGYTTKLLTEPAVDTLVFQTNGDLVAAYEGSAVVVRSISNGAIVWQYPVSTKLIGLDFVGEQIAWIDNQHQLTATDLQNRQVTTYQLDSQWFIRQLQFANDWFAIAYTYNEKNYFATLNRQTGVSESFENRGWQMEAEGDWAVWYEQLSATFQVVAYNLRTQERRLLDALALGSSISFHNDQIATVRMKSGGEPSTTVAVYNLSDASTKLYQYSFDFLNVHVIGDFLQWSNRTMNGVTHGVIQLSTGIQRRLSSSDHWDGYVINFVVEPQLTMLWFGILQSKPNQANLFATTFSINQIPSAMQPEAPSNAAGSRYFPETKHNLVPPFTAYWQTHGGLSTFGYPLSARFDEVNRDTQTSYPTQYVERQRFEHHVEHKGTVYEVLLGRLGAEILVSRGRDWRDEDHDLPDSEQLPGNCQTFDTTQRTVCGPFLQYWQNHGLDFGESGVSYAESLALFGLPLTAPRYENNPDGAFVLTQWFERARFEWHPNNPPEYQVLLGRLGDELLAVRGWRE